MLSCDCVTGLSTCIQDAHGCELIETVLHPLHDRLEVRAAEEADFREAYSGPLTSSKVIGLLPGTNYLFRCALSLHRSCIARSGFIHASVSVCSLRQATVAWLPCVHS